MPRYGHRHWPKVWITLIALDTAVEVWALRHSRREATLSHFLRGTFRTDTAAGRVILCTGWVVLTAKLLPHLCNQPKG